MTSSPSASTLHVVLFPFMSKGHTIPLLHLARLLLHRNAAVTIFTTRENRPFITKSLENTDASVVDLPFPENIAGVPPGVESTEKLPSMSLFVPFANATKRMQPHFETALENLPYVTFIVSDSFLGWTVESATKLGIPRLVFHGMSNFASTISRETGFGHVFGGPEHDDEPLPVPNFPCIKLTRNDFTEPFNMREPKGPHFEFILEQIIAVGKSYGVIMNSFYELEASFIDHWNRENAIKAWNIGPLFLAQPSSPLSVSQNKPQPGWLSWLDQKLADKSSVLYVAFGTQAELSVKQFQEIAMGLEESNQNFLWLVRKSESELPDGFEERVKDRGIVVREWVDQRAILEHGSVKGFLSHCGWNSVLESVCAGVPILAWPMMADQHLNARMVVEVIKVGLRVETCNGSVRGFVEWESLGKTVRELMEGEKGKEVKKAAEEFSKAARIAVEEGGSSWETLNNLLNELQELRGVNPRCRPSGEKVRGPRVWSLEVSGSIPTEH